MLQAVLIVKLVIRISINIKHKHELDYLLIIDKIVNFINWFAQIHSKVKLKPINSRKIIVSSCVSPVKIFYFHFNLNIAKYKWCPLINRKLQYLLKPEASQILHIIKSFKRASLRPTIILMRSSQSHRRRRMAFKVACLKIQESSAPILQFNGHGPFEKLFFDDDGYSSLCLPICVNTYFGSSIFGTEAAIKQWWKSLPKEVRCSSFSAACILENGHECEECDPMIGGFPLECLWHLPICEVTEGEALRPHPFKLIVWTIQPNECMLPYWKLDIMGTMGYLQDHRVQEVLISLQGEQAHLWGAKFHQSEGRWWFFSNHESGVLTQSAWQKECEAIGYIHSIIFMNFWKWPVGSPPCTSQKLVPFAPIFL